MVQQLAGKVAIVTGGAGGIGSAICERLAEEGAKVVVHYGGHADAANEIVNAIKTKGGEAIAVQANLSHIDEVTKLFDAAQQQFGSLVILVNNAGTGVGGSIVETDETAFDKVFGLNAKGTFLHERSRQSPQSKRTNCEYFQWSTAILMCWFTKMHRERSR